MIAPGEPPISRTALRLSAAAGTRAASAAAAAPGSGAAARRGVVCLDALSAPHLLALDDEELAALAQFDADEAERVREQ